MVTFGLKTSLFFRRNYAMLSLNSAQVAFVNRLGIQDIPVNKILSALAHPKLPSKEPKNPELKLSDFNLSFDVGRRAFKYFSKEYLKNRFPGLDPYSIEKYYFRIGLDTFTANINILQFARFLGIESAVGFKSAVSSLSRKTSTKKSRKIIDPESADEQTKVAVEIHSETFIAILGLMGSELGPLALRNFLDTRYFNNSHFNAKDFVRPLYPIPELTFFYPELVFRLHQESGRFSNNSMYVVGVYASSDEGGAMLGEGYGESIILAQHRAATEALREIYLSEKRITTRESDTFSHINQVHDGL